MNTSPISERVQSKATPGPQAPAVVLSELEQQELGLLLRRHSTAQQVVLRAQIVLATAAGKNNCEIARSLGVSLDMVRLWRERWLSLTGLSLEEMGLTERLQDAPRSGRSVRISAEQVCEIIALACEAPSASGRPISQWSAQEIAEEVKRRKIVGEISPRHAARLLKRGLSNHT